MPTIPNGIEIATGYYWTIHNVGTEVVYVQMRGEQVGYLRVGDQWWHEGGADQNFAPIERMTKAQFEAKFKQAT